MITHKAPRTCYIFLAACCYCQSTIKTGTQPNKINQRAQTVWGSLLVCPSNESSQSDPPPRPTPYQEVAKRKVKARFGGSEASNWREVESNSDSKLQSPGIIDEILSGLFVCVSLLLLGNHPRTKARTGYGSVPIPTSKRTVKQAYSEGTFNHPTIGWILSLVRNAVQNTNVCVLGSF